MLGVDIAKAAHNLEGTQGPGASQQWTHQENFIWLWTGTLLGTASEKKREFNVSGPQARRHCHSLAHTS